MPTRTVLRTINAPDFTFPVPPGFSQVPQEQFYATLYADSRDIMPTVENSDSFSDWVAKGGELWGRSFPGWKNPGDAKAYFIKAT